MAFKSIAELLKGRNFIKEIRAEQRAFDEMQRRNDPSFRSLKVKHYSRITKIKIKNA